MVGVAYSTFAERRIRGGGQHEREDRAARPGVELDDPVHHDGELPGDREERASDRDREQRAEHTGELRSHQHRAEHDERRELHRPAVDERLQDVVQQFLLRNLFPETFSDTVMRHLQEFAERAHRLSVVGAIVFFMTAITSLRVIETTLNAIWATGGLDGHRHVVHGHCGLLNACVGL